MKDLLVFLADGFEEVEALSVVDILRRGGLSVDTCSIKDSKKVTSSHQVTVLADVHIDDIKIDNYKACYIPGGQPGATNLQNDRRIIQIVEMFKEQGKLVAAICAGPQVLDTAGVLTDEKFTCYPGVEERLKTKKRLDVPVVVDDNIITAMGPAMAPFLGYELLKILSGKKKAKEVGDGFLINKIKKFIKEDII